MGLHAVFASRFEIDGVVGIRSRLDTTCRPLSDFKKFNATYKLFPPVYLEIRCGYPSI